MYIYTYTYKQIKSVYDDMFLLEGFHLINQTWYLYMIIIVFLLDGFHVCNKTYMDSSTKPKKKNNTYQVYFCEMFIY